MLPAPILHAPPADAPPGADSYLGRTGRPRVMVCGQPEARASILEILEGNNFHLYESQNDETTLEIAGQERPDIVLLDYGCEEFDASALCRRLKDNPDSRDIFVMLLFPQGQENPVEITEDSECDEHLVAPWNGDDLMPRIRAGLRIVELSRMLQSRNEDFRRVTRRLNQELSVVSQIQKDLLPQDIPETPGLDFTFFYLPSSECGGDYYDLVVLDEEHLGLVLADVSGHGAPAMVTMAMLRQNFHFIAQSFREPEKLLEELNRLLFKHLPTEQFATMFYAIINTRTRLLRYSSAGQTPPLWWRKQKGASELLPDCEGFPLKLVTDDATYQASEIQLDSQDKLVFYTDGVTECFNPRREIYGQPRLQAVIDEHAPQQGPRQLESAIVSDLLTFADSHDTEDDVTLVILGVDDEENEHPAAAGPDRF